MDTNIGKRRSHHHTPTILFMNLINKTEVEQYISAPIYPFIFLHSFLHSFCFPSSALFFHLCQSYLWMGTGGSMARRTFISMKRQKIKTLGSHSSFQTSEVTAEEGNTLNTTHYWNSWISGEKIEGEMATDTLPVAACYMMYLKLRYCKVFILK